MAVPLGYFLATRDGDRIDFVWQIVTELGTPIGVAVDVGGEEMSAVYLPLVMK